MKHKDLDIWKIGVDLVLDIYQVARKNPDYEKYGLSSQIQRAAVSIPSNIAEGAARNTSKEFLHFLYTARGSLSELDTQLIIAKRLGYLTDADNNHIQPKLAELWNKLNALIKKMRLKES